jgi:hypothetical protein
MNITRIATLLASGLKPANVASIVGCSPARISQLAKESEEFRNLLALKEAEAQKDDIEETALSTKYHAAEHALLDQVLSMAPVSELRDVVGALRVVAERQEKVKTRLNPIVQSQPIINQIVQINIPSHALPEVVLTKDYEVVSVDNLNLAPLTSQGVTNLFKNLKEKENEQRRISAETERPIEEVISIPEEVEI